MYHTKICLSNNFSSIKAKYDEVKQPFSSGFILVRLVSHGEKVVKLGHKKMKGIRKLNTKSLETLEFNKIIKILESYAVTALGKEKVLALEPSSNTLEIEQWQKETEESSSYLIKQHDIPIGQIPNIKEQIQKVNIGGTLGIEELLRFVSILKTSRRLKQSFNNG